MQAVQGFWDLLKAALVPIDTECCYLNKPNNTPPDPEWVRNMDYEDREDRKLLRKKLEKEVGCAWFSTWLALQWSLHWLSIVEFVFLEWAGYWIFFYFETGFWQWAIAAAIFIPLFVLRNVVEDIKMEKCD